MDRRTALSLTFLLVAVVAVVATPGPTGTAVAEPDTNPGGNCAPSEFLIGLAEDCDLGVASPTDPGDGVSLYQAALQTDSGTNQYFDLFNNQLEQSKEVAWLKAERAIAEAAKNGSTQTSANIDATEAIKEYYALMERNLLDKWNLYLQGLSTYETDSDGVSGYDMFSITGVKTNADYDRHKLEKVEFWKLGQENYTLIDGTKVNQTVAYLNFTAGQYDSYGTQTDTATETHTVGLDNAQESFRIETADNWVEGKWTGAELNPPTDDYEKRNYLSTERFQFNRNRLENLKTALVNDSESFVSNTYPAYEDGTINVSDFLSRTNKMYNYAVNNGDQTAENSTFNEAIIALSGIGLSAPENTSYMEIRYEGYDGVNRTVKGLLMSDDQPPGGFVTNKTYDESNLSGPQMIATLDGAQKTINGTFRILSVWDGNGTEIQDPTLTVPEKDYEISNTSEAQALLAQLEGAIERINNLSTSGSGGGSAGGGSGLLSGLSGFSIGDLGLGGLFSGALSGLVQIAVVLLLGAVALAILLGALIPS